MRQFGRFIGRFIEQTGNEAGTGTGTGTNGTKLSNFGVIFFAPANTPFVLSLSKGALRQAQDERYLLPGLADQDLLNDRAGGDPALCEQTLNTLNLVPFGTGTAMTTCPCHAFPYSFFSQRISELLHILQQLVKPQPTCQLSTFSYLFGGFQAALIRSQWLAPHHRLPLTSAAFERSHHKRPWLSCPHPLC